ncbi:MAG: hypothetical protein JXK93_07850 [Sphaerochaetaceae bacterium]|nr:hypothetical protein [Sphaerochaetaceae bacterium]
MKQRTPFLLYLTLFLCVSGTVELSGVPAEVMKEYDLITRRFKGYHTIYESYIAKEPEDLSLANLFLLSENIRYLSDRTDTAVNTMKERLSEIETARAKVKQQVGASDSLVLKSKGEAIDETLAGERNTLLEYNDTLSSSGTHMLYLADNLDTVRRLLELCDFDESLSTRSLQRSLRAEKHYAERHAGQLEEYEQLMTRSVETLPLSEIDSLLTRLQVVSQDLAQERNDVRDLIAHGKHVMQIIEKEEIQGDRWVREVHTSIVQSLNSRITHLTEVNNHNGETQREYAILIKTLSDYRTVLVIADFPASGN